MAILPVKPKLTKEFEANFRKAQKIISSMKGYVSNDLKKCVENKNRYILFVNWETMEDHE